jgi:circadian clock protein KaiC
MSGRLRSGQARLDGVLDGGLPENAITLLIGLPGSGKTILAEQYVFANATPERPAVYLSTVSEPFDKLIRYGQTLSFFDAKAIGHSVFYEDLGSVLNEKGLPGVLDKITALLRDRRPSIMVIDSFKALSAYADDAGMRPFLHDLAGQLTALPLSSFWVGEYGEQEIGNAPEFAIADAIISLTTTRTAQREGRWLRIMKLRGSNFAPGQHSYRLSADGLDVFPRLADVPDIGGYTLSDARIRTGIAAFDEMLADGYQPGSSTLCAGPSGTGKTLMGLHFIFNTVAGEPGVLATLQEHPVQLERIVQGFGWSLDNDAVELMYRSPIDIYIDEWVYTLLETVERIGARRVLIDSLSDLQHAAPDPVRFREYMYSLVQRLARSNVSLFMTAELTDLFETTNLSEHGISHLADNVVLLEYVRDGATLRRALTVLKTRASRHEPETREYTITSNGIVLEPTAEPTPERAR